jgi:DNA polymerase-4
VRKIIHIDMDCFYAAIEERENPSLCGKPVAVGGNGRRGVLTTANYEARKYGCRSAMPVFKALALCPQLILVPVHFDLYRSVSSQIRAIFGRFTEKIEPLSLDEAYLDVSEWQTSGSAIAREIRAQISEETKLTASAGIGPNKLIAKIASDWNKPNGQKEVLVEEVSDFLLDMPVAKIPGVGKKMNEKLSAMGVKTCGDLRRFEPLEMHQRFGTWGAELWQLCRGIDLREVECDRPRKSLSEEHTFHDSIETLPALRSVMGAMIASVREDCQRHHADRAIRSLLVKLKFADFQRTTAERAMSAMDDTTYDLLLQDAWQRGQGRAVRLLGVGVRFADQEEDPQMEFLLGQE